MPKTKKSKKPAKKITKKKKGAKKPVKKPAKKAVKKIQTPKQLTPEQQKLITELLKELESI
ncbi:MAG: hypothetical protein US74_C0008G0013 [Parcubacteria group bacterium GW2011_GWA2_38_13]|nr:MAG: hypothetical protein US74_C0008G0013 [Parcubacteria group bacterium GW2011_GWA2_38_13]